VILAGDIGGTHARLCLLTEGGKQLVRQASLPSRRYPSLEAVMHEFLGAPRPDITAAVLGVAGPVVDNRCTATNLPWVIDGAHIAQSLGIPRVRLLNDLVAVGLGALVVPHESLHVLQGNAPPQRKEGTIAVIAAGTGLGEAMLMWDAETGRYIPCATEGGHADFAPRDDLEIELLQFLRQRYGRVSYERVLAGPGIGNLYDFFRIRKGMSEPSAITDAILAAEDRNALISRFAVEGASEPCVRSLELFASVYGAEAGNLALKTLAIGGVFVAGSIAVHILKFLQQGCFTASFTTKGRFSPLMETIPVAVVLDPDVGILGSGYAASRL
jgi:glucokinase